MNCERRSAAGELRASSADEGIIEGYAAVWDTVDSYTSTFQRGAFLKTLKERGSRVKVLWNHSDEVIGVPIELYEDEHGLFVRAKLTLAVGRARDVFELIKAGAVDTFSFAFRVIKEKWVAGVRVITEVALMEVSPVIFEANSAAVITGVRAMDKEQRSKVYAETYGAYELAQRSDLIMSALYRTVNDIWWSDDKDPSAIRTQIMEALTAFVEVYAVYTDDVLSQEQRAAPGEPELAKAVRSFLTSIKQTPEQLAASTSLTLDEVRALQAGSLVVAREKLPEQLQPAYAQARAAKLLSLCDELRSGLSEPERERILGLLNPPAAAVDSALAALSSFRKTLTGDQS